MSSNNKTGNATSIIDDNVNNGKSIIDSSVDSGAVWSFIRTVPKFLKSKILT